MEKVLAVINDMLENMNKDVLQEYNPNISLRNDLGFDSFDLAELTVRIEDLYGIDIFEDGLIDTLAELQARLNA